MVTLMTKLLIIYNLLSNMKPSLDELFGQSTQTSQSKPSLNDIFSGSTSTQTEQPSATTGDTGLKGFATGFAKSGLNTLQNLGNMVLNPAKKLLGLEGVKTGVSEETLTPQTSAEKVGKVTGDIAQFFIPAGNITKATKGLSFIPRVLGRAGGDVAISGVQSGGDATDMTTTGLTSVAFQSASPLLKVLGSIGKRTGAVLAGTGSDVIEQAIKTPRETSKAIKIPALKTIQEDTQNILSSVRKLSSDATENYGKALDELPKRLGRNPEVITAGQKTTIKADGKTYTLSMQGVKSNLTETLRKYGVDVNPKKKTLDFLGTTLDNSEEKRLREVFDVINQWKDTTPRGLNTLSTKLSNFKKAGEQSKQLNSIIGSISSNVRDYIGKRVPEVKALNDTFSTEKRFIDELDAYLSTGEGFNTPENAKAVMGKIQTLFTKNKEVARNVLENLQGGQNILARQAGRELQSGIPRSTASIGDRIGGLVQTVIPPKVIGEVATKVGIAQEALAPIFSQLEKIAPEQRILFINAMRDLVND